MHTHTQGVLKESAPNELHPALPVMTRTHVHTHMHTHTHTQGVLKESAPNELHPALPVMTRTHVHTHTYTHMHTHAGRAEGVRT